MKYSILVVDDEENITSSFRRFFHKDYNIKTAINGKEALDIIKNNFFHVIISDMRMPEMDGLTFLKKAKKIAPDSQRIMLTGNADMQTAIDAINLGNIFRFVNKPISLIKMNDIIKDAIKQYNLINTEKELLDKTLNGIINVLTDVLSMINPAAFSRGSRIKRIVDHITKTLGLKDNWQYKIASQLSQIGCVIIPTKTINKMLVGEDLNDAEKKIINNYPALSSKLVSNIPRFEIISKMLLYQLYDYEKIEATNESLEVKIGAEILKISLDFDIELVKGYSYKDSLINLLKKGKLYNKEALLTLNNFVELESDTVIKSVNVEDLTTDMIIDEDVKASNGILLVPKGKKVNNSIIALLDSFVNGIGVKEPIRTITKQ